MCLTVSSLVSRSIPLLLGGIVPFQLRSKTTVLRAHVEAEIPLPWITKIHVDTGDVKLVWPPHEAGSSMCSLSNTHGTVSLSYDILP